MTDQSNIQRLMAVAEEGNEMMRRIISILAGHSPDAIRGVILQLLAHSLATFPPHKRERELKRYLKAMPQLIEMYDAFDPPRH